MRRLIDLFNKIIKKHKKLKKWQRFVTVLAAMITFVTTYALILPAITVEKDKTDQVSGMYLEEEAELVGNGEEEAPWENALVPLPFVIAADQENAVTYLYEDDDIFAELVISTDEELPEGTELALTYVDPESEAYADLGSRAKELLGREFISETTSCSFYDFALVCDNVDVTPRTGFADIHIEFKNNTVEHTDDALFAGKFALPPAFEGGLLAVSADETATSDETSDPDKTTAQNETVADYENELPAEEYAAGDELVSVNGDGTSVFELSDGIITSLTLKGCDFTVDDSMVGILAGLVDEELKTAAEDSELQLSASEDVEDSEYLSDAELPEKVEEDDTTSAPSVGTLTASGKDYTVKLTYDETSGVPAGSRLEVSEISQNSKVYRTYLEETKKAMGLTEEETLPQYAARFFDIKIMVGEDEFTPKSGVTVEIAYTEPLAANPETEVSAVHFQDDTTEPEVIDASATEVAKDGTATVEFEAESFSVYGVIYTVDFHWEVDGKVYDFSIPGGGFVSFYDLVEVLGIIGNTNNDKNGDENRSEIAENADQNGANEGTEENGVNTASNTVLTLDDVEVSEATRRFVADVTSVEVSTPTLVDVSKVEVDATVGQIKENRGLECKYSAELTEEQIAEINNSKVEAGDWALISLLPFTSVEMMTITMKDGSVFTIKVTDAQAASTSENPYTNDFRSNNGNRFVIWGWGTDGQGYALNKDGGTTVIDPNNLDNAPVDVQWTIEYGYNNGNNDYRYYIRSVANNKYFALNSGYHVGRDLVQDDVCGIHLYPPYTYHYNQQHPYDPRYADSSNTGWLVEGWGWTRLNLSTWNNNFEGHNNHCSNTNITKLTPPNEYTFTVKTEDIRKGYVSCGNQTQAIELTATSNTSNTWIKSNKDIIKAEPVSSGKYMFDYWDLDGKKLDLGPEIGIGELELSGNGGVLTAHFKMDPSYTPSDEEKEGHSIDKTALANWLSNLKEREVPFGTDGCNKTAELFDYENRIYRVDLTAKSNLTTFVGDIDLGFMLDVSSSMKFPAKLSPVEGLESVDINHINDNSTNQAELTKGTTYYLISDKGSTATVYEIRWGTWRYDQYGNTRTGWGYKDASKDDSQMNYIRPASVWSGGESGLSYPIYTDGDPGHDRRYYLETSISNTITELNNILNALSVAEVSSKDPTVKIAWNTFHKWVVNPHHEFTSVRGTTINPTYSYSGGTSADLALLDAAGKKRSDDDGVSSHLKYNWENGMYYTDVEGFQWDEDAAKYAVLITDGAPQRNGIDVGAELVEDGADFLKKGADGIAGTDDDVKLMTVGLSMGDVKKGSVRLYDISSPDAEGFPLFYKAEYGDELQYALYQVLREAMADAIVQCDITDTVNEAFYPIDLNTGMPLGNNDIISLGGVRLGNNVNALTAEQKKAGYGIVHKSGETYTVTWLNQDVYGEEEGGWQGTVYVKAREDFLGGNSVRTNPSDEDGPKAKVEAKSYKMKPEDEPIALKQSLIAENGTVELDTPRVNVNELDIPDLDTEWNVYLGTTVDDALLQLKKLYEEIKVLEVVKLGQAQDANGSGFSDKITGNKDTSYYYPMKESASDARESEASGENEFFYLKDLIKKINNGSDLTDEDWQRMVELSEYPEEDKEHPEVAGPFNTGISFTYDLYGQDCPGTITLRIMKDHDFGEHVTDHTGAPVETYTLKVIFTPNYDHIPEGIGGEDPWEYHTGRNRPLGYGNAAGTEELLNNHEINVFAKKLQILKVDQAENVITDDRATFKLYREALDGEEDQILPPEDVPSFLPTGKNYILADTLTTDSEGKAITNIDISKLPDNAPYFLVETDAPDGYSLLPGALEVRAMTDAETNTGTVPQDVWTKVPVTTPPQTSNTKWSPYVLSNWEQNATIIIKANEALAGYAIREGNITYDHNQEDTLVKVKYKIRNNEGIELPATGGPGTRLFTILGSILILGAGVLLWRRQGLT